MFVQNLVFPFLSTQKERNGEPPMSFFKRSSPCERSCRRICFLLTLALLLAVFCLPVSGAESDPPALVSQEYLQKQLEALRKELLEAIANVSGTPVENLTQESDYLDVTLPRGSVITLGEDAEVIFRGGNAVVLTVTGEAGAGLADLATGEEVFSGTLLQFAHIYYKSAPKGRVSLLVTGEKAAFTLKGTYDIS